jgi:hypothetical protein
MLTIGGGERRPLSHPSCRTNAGGSEGHCVYPRRHPACRKASGCHFIPRAGKSAQPSMIRCLVQSGARHSLLGSRLDASAARRVSHARPGCSRIPRVGHRRKRLRGTRTGVAKRRSDRRTGCSRPSRDRSDRAWDPASCRSAPRPSTLASSSASHGTRRSPARSGCFRSRRAARRRSRSACDSGVAAGAPAGGGRSRGRSTCGSGEREGRGHAPPLLDSIARPLQEEVRDRVHLHGA